MSYKTSEEKLQYVSSYLSKLMCIAEMGVKKGKYNLAFSALSAYCQAQYLINQVYTDSKAEDLLLQISMNLVNVATGYKPRKNTVLFYDGFGLDLRGWAASFAKALSGLNYDVVYVAPMAARGQIPHIVKEVEKGKGRIEYIDMKQSYTSHVKALNDIFNHYQPKAAFFYTTPNDVSGATVFDAFKGKLLRIQVDLTDHAFWIGVNAFDYAIHCRVPSASNMVYHRGVDASRIRRMDCCPYISRDTEPLPFPFDIKNEKYVFSGGSLYKTLGDENLYFYKIIDHILAQHNSIKFLFAGSGDDTELKKIITKYPNRAFHIQERSDFIQMFENCIFFLNTYPMFGGLMMRYAAMVGKIPLTLKHGSDHEGLLYEQEKRGIEFDTYEEIIAEADKLIDDSAYRTQKEKLLRGSVMTEEEFSRNVYTLIEEEKTDYYFEEIPEIDTSAFRAEYIERLIPEKMLEQCIATRRNGYLIPYFSLLFMKRALRRF